MKTCSVTVNLNTARVTNGNAQSKTFDVAMYGAITVELMTKGYGLLDAVEMEDGETVVYCYGKKQ